MNGAIATSKELMEFYGSQNKKVKALLKPAIHTVVKSKTPNIYLIQEREAEQLKKNQQIAFEKFFSQSKLIPPPPL